LTSVTYIISDIDKALAFEWIVQYLDEKKFKLNFILLNNIESELEKFLRTQNITVDRVPLTKGVFLVFPFIRIWWKLLLSRTEIVHTHLRYASLLGITAGFLAGIKKRIHTRHHSTSNHIYHPHAVWTDRWISYLSTDVVAISDVVFEVLHEKENVSESKIRKIPHGFDLSYFEKVDPLEVENLRSKYGLANSYPVVGVISRYLELKGVEYAIRAFKKIKRDYPDAVLVLANANGPYKDSLHKELQAQALDSYIEIKFEPNLSALYRLFDVFLHLPIDPRVEAFGQTYIEALACGVPSVFTLSGIAHECIVNEENALVVPYQNAEATADAMLRFLSDKALARRIKENGRLTAKQFDLKIFISRLEDLYRA